jgi:hexosaminidase
LAERAWSPSPSWSDIEDTEKRNGALDEAWNAMANAIGRRELPRLDHLHGGVSYRIAPPGAILENGRLEANVAFPGLAIRYTTDGTEPTMDSAIYREPVEVSGTVKVRAINSLGRGSRTVELGLNER